MKPAMKKIEMVDLGAQTLKIRPEIDAAIARVIDSGRFIHGPEVAGFEKDLAAYLGCSHTIGCANGTDALQIALMALGLQPGDEVIVPAFTYVATAEVIALLGLKPVMADVDEHTFNMGEEHIEPLIGPKTRAIVPVHLYGQSCDMEAILHLAGEHGIPVVEDNAQAIGAACRFRDGSVHKTGTMGAIGTTSFFPSKNLGCFGDGGALTTNDDDLADTLRVIANHGQRQKYYHERIGVNSRLDTIQAAILQVKLRHLDDYIAARQRAADHYDKALAGLKEVRTPACAPWSDHVFHQYTLRVPATARDELKNWLAERGIPSMIYYPLPLYAQEAFRDPAVRPEDFPATNKLCGEVISLPMHTELDAEVLDYISGAVADFFRA